MLTTVSLQNLAKPSRENVVFHLTSKPIVQGDVDDRGFIIDRPDDEPIRLIGYLTVGVEPEATTVNPDQYRQLGCSDGIVWAHDVQIETVL